MDFPTNILNFFMITYFSDRPQPSSVKQLSSKVFDIGNILICFAFQSE